MPNEPSDGAAYVRLHPATLNLLGAARDLVSMMEHQADTGGVGAFEAVERSKRLERLIDVWRTHGCPNAPESDELEG